MILDYFKQVFEDNKKNVALIHEEKSVTYGTLLEQWAQWAKSLTANGIKSGTVVLVKADFSPASIPLLFALLDTNAIIVPTIKTIDELALKNRLDTAQAEYLITMDARDDVQTIKTNQSANHSFYNLLKSRNHPGFVFFTTGSTGKSKGAVHDALGLLEKFELKRHVLRTITFLLFDHLGGLNTMFYVLSNAGTLITVPERTADCVLGIIEKQKVELLATTPTFLNLVLFSQLYKKYNLTSLKIISYGTEAMPETTLKKLYQLFPHVELRQTYGMSEVGIPRSKSRNPDSLWMKIGGAGFQIRVVDGCLQIKSPSTMLGYLNAPSPFTKDGWFMTGDRVEVDGDYIKILGRESEIINVGGQKVLPHEVEGVIMEMEGVEDTIVYGEKNPIIGQIVCCDLQLRAGGNKVDIESQLKKHCSTRLEKYKVPIKINFVDRLNYSERFKKIKSPS